MPMPLQPIRPKKISDQVFDQIRESIFRGQLKPGEQVLPERELSEALGVSRTTVRLWQAAGLLQMVELPFGMRRNLYRRVDVEAFLARARDRA